MLAPPLGKMPAVGVRVLTGADLSDALPRLLDYVSQDARVHPAHHPLWMYVLKEGLGLVPYAIEATAKGRTVGYLPLSFVRSTLFGRFLVSLPFVNTAGVRADDEFTRFRLIDRAVELGKSLKVRHLELRHEQPTDNPRLNGTRSNKVHMRMPLPAFPGPLWEGLPSKVRNQVRKGEKSGLTVHWGAADLLDDFYGVFATNMRDLGTPVYSPQLFRSVLRHFPGAAEICVVRLRNLPVAASILVHGKGITEVPSASSMRAYNHLCPNMLMYWNLLDRAVQRGQSAFDFGRASRDGSTYKFKQQWGAIEGPAVWQYHLDGNAADLRTDNPRYSKFIKLWQRLPVSLTRVIGPPIVRGIP